MKCRHRFEFRAVYSFSLSRYFFYLAVFIFYSSSTISIIFIVLYYIGSTMSTITSKILRFVGLGKPNGISVQAEGNTPAAVKRDDDYLHIPSLLSTIFYLIVIFGIGVPVWFWTCSVARHPLPDIKLLVNNYNGSRLKLDISIVLLERSQQKEPTDEYAKSLRELLPSSELSVNNLYYDFNWRVRRPLDEELKIFSEALRQTSVNSGEYLRKIEEKLSAVHAENNRFRLWVYLIDEKHYDNYCQKAHSFSLGFERFVFVCPSIILPEKDRPQTSSRLIMDAVRETYLNSIDIKHINHLLSSELDLVVNMIAENDDEIVDFDELNAKAERVHSLIKKNVRESYPELTELVNIKVKSQSVFNSFDRKIFDQAIVKQTKNQTSHDYRLFDIKKYRQFINSVRSRISEHQEKHIYHLLLLIPSLGRPEILFHQTSRAFDEASISKLSLLVSSDSNSMLIWNNDKHLVLGLRTLYRHILGFSWTNIHSQCFKRNIFFTKWEIDSLLAVMTMAKLSKTSKSLESIKDLVDKVSNIVIEKDVANRMEQASKLSLQSLAFIESGDIVNAYRRSSKAYELSESAFFDPSLLELLYFPHDQKYAIYFPLFMPLSFPIGVSILRLLKSFFLYRRQSKAIIKEKQN